MIAEVLAPLRKAQRTAQPAAKIHEPVVQRLPHSTLLIRCRDLLRAPHRCLASAGFRGSPESCRKAKPSLEIEIAAALLWRKSSHLQSPAKKELAEPPEPAAAEPVDGWFDDAMASGGKGGGT